MAAATLINKVISLLRFRIFERSIDKRSVKAHRHIVEWAEHCSKHADQHEQPLLYEGNIDPIVKQGYRLLNTVRAAFHDRCRHLSYLRIAVHVPPAARSPAGHSLFRNLALSFQYIGIPSICLEWGSDLDALLTKFKPRVLITSDNEEYLRNIDWQVLGKYRRSHDLYLGLTASLQQYGNTPLSGRLNWARRNGVDFYYSFRSPEYISERIEYRPFFDSGYDVVSVEFGANPLSYYPVPGFERDLDYVFLASSNYDKRARYYGYLTRIVSRYFGLIDGPGWSLSRNFSFNASRDRYLYARAKVGLNLSIEDQIHWSSELNERTYMLAACGVPQLIDAPKLLPSRFGPDCMYVAHSPDEYFSLFEEMLADPEQAKARSFKALNEVFSKHTTFHRAETFALNIAKVSATR